MSGPSKAFLDGLSSSLSRPSSRYLIPCVVSTALGLGPVWLPRLYSHFSSSLPPAPPSPSPSPTDVDDDPVPRRILVRKVKEALTKSTVLVGVPKVIETMLELVEIVEPGARDGTFVRREMEGMEGEEVLRKGDEALGRIYREDIHAIWDKMTPDLLDIRFLSRFMTYGTVLSPLQPTSPLSLIETEVVVLSCLIPQRTPREISWHLRGMRRVGMSREEVEETQRGIERTCRECGMVDVEVGMPRVADVEEEE